MQAITEDYQEDLKVVPWMLFMLIFAVKDRLSLRFRCLTAFPCVFTAFHHRRSLRFQKIPRHLLAAVCLFYTRFFVTHRISRIFSGLHRAVVQRLSLGRQAGHRHVVRLHGHGGRNPVSTWQCLSLLFSQPFLAKAVPFAFTASPKTVPFIAVRQRRRELRRRAANIRGHRHPEGTETREIVQSCRHLTSAVREIC